MDKSRLYALIFVALIALGIGGGYLYERHALIQSFDLKVMPFEEGEEESILEMIKHSEEIRLKKSAEVGVFDFDNSRYVRFDLVTSEILKEDSLKGFNLIEGDYMNYSDYLLLSKKGTLYSYSKQSGEVKDTGISMADYDEVYVLPTYDDSNVVAIYLGEFNEDSDGYVQIYLRTNRFIFDLESNDYIELDNKDPQSGFGICERYSSDGNKLISWPCPPVISLNTPVLLTDVVTGEEQILFEGIGDHSLGADVMFQLDYNKLMIAQSNYESYVDENDGKVGHRDFLRNLAIIDLNNFEVEEYSYDLDNAYDLPWHNVVYDEERGRVILASGKDYYVIKLLDSVFEILESEPLAQSKRGNYFVALNGLLAYSEWNRVYIRSLDPNDLVATSFLDDSDNIRLIDVFSAE